MNMMMDDKKKINIELTDDVAAGDYANLAIITHSPSEFVIDFVNMMPGMPKAKVGNRIILAPQHAKRLMRALAENVAKYEQAHGQIKEIERDPTLIMRGPTAEA